MGWKRLQPSPGLKALGTKVRAMEAVAERVGCRRFPVKREPLDLGECGRLRHPRQSPLMAAGRPVLFIGPRESTPALIIERFGCGWRVDAGDSAGLTTLLRRLAANRGVVRVAGERARQAFLAHFDRADGVARICGILGARETAEARAAAEACDARAEVLAG